MAANQSLQDALDDAERIINTWLENPDFALGEVERSMLETLVTEVRAAELEIEKERIKLTGMVETRDKKLDTLVSYTTRARGGFRAVYGADSIQYKQAGGTITSERKAPKRKPKTSYLCST